jgi:hypothetical protein
MTPKQRVLKKYPNARLVRSAHGTYWQCSTKEWAGGRVIGEGALPFQAWADGAKHLRPTTRPGEGS